MSFPQRKDIVRNMLQEGFSGIHAENGLEEEVRLEAVMEKRKHCCAEENNISKCRLFYMHCLASGSASADNYSPYIVFTSGLAGGQGPARKTPPSFCLAHRAHSVSSL